MSIEIRNYTKQNKELRDLEYLGNLIAKKIYDSVDFPGDGVFLLAIDRKKEYDKYKYSELFEAKGRPLLYVKINGNEISFLAERRYDLLKYTHNEHWANFFINSNSTYRSMSPALKERCNKFKILYYRDDDGSIDYSEFFNEIGKVNDKNIFIFEQLSNTEVSFYENDGSYVWRAIATGEKSEEELENSSAVKTFKALAKALF